MPVALSGVRLSGGFTDRLTRAMATLRGHAAGPPWDTARDRVRPQVRYQTHPSGTRVAKSQHVVCQLLTVVTLDLSPHPFEEPRVAP